MTRKQYIEQFRRQIYGGQPSDDATITENLVNQWLEQAIGFAAQKCYETTGKLEAVAYVNNAFYSTFKALTVTSDERNTWKVQLPQVPVGIGANEGVSTLEFKNDDGLLSLPVVWMSENQKGIYRTMRNIPNKLLAYNEGDYVYIISTLRLSNYTASVTMISGGVSTNLNSTLNVPPDYITVMTEYLKQQLMFERTVPTDTQNDGMDFIKST
jgi:hypothetical protein